jgi:hypothetical protein
MVQAAVRVEGLAQLNRELRRLASDRTWQKELGLTNQKAAKIPVAPMKRQAPRGATGGLSTSPRALKAAGRVAIAVGSAKVPYAGPINFGWPARNIAPQEFIYKSITETHDEFMEIYLDMIDDLTTRAFPN